jgi:glycosyltransferase involved in cell wall biosynthesis
VHVGLNLIYLVPGESGGTETYARELIPALVAAAPSSQITAFINREAARSRAPAPWRDLIPSVTVPVSAQSRLQWVRGEQQLLPRLAVRAGVDLVHSLANTAPAWGQFRRVVTIHDLHFKLAPEAHLGLAGLGMRVLVPLAARQSNRVIVDAMSTRDELKQHLGIEADKVDAIPLGFGNTQSVEPLQASILRERLGLGQRKIVLSVSAKRPHKNLVRLITAVGLIPVERRPVVVIPGYPTPHEEELRHHAAELGVTDDVRLLGWIEPETLEGLYSAASCLVCASLHEGFGLPVLEAMARGLPVACSGRGALAEVGGDAVVRFDPASPEQIAAAIERLLGDPEEAQRLRAAGLERAGSFTWRATAVGTLASYERALS